MDLSILTALDGFGAVPVAGLLAVAIWLVLSGRIIPAGRVDREIAAVRKDRDDRLAEKDAEIARAHDGETEWRDAWGESQRINAEVRSQNRDLIDSLYFVRKVVGAFPRPDDEDGAT